MPWQGGTLIVEVKDLHGRPLPGVRVMVRGWDMGGLTSGFGDDTNERGKIEAVVRTGEIEVLLGYRRRVIDVREGRETRVEFRYQAEGEILVQPLEWRPAIRRRGTKWWLIRHGLVRGEDGVRWIQLPPGEYEVGGSYGNRVFRTVQVESLKTTIVRRPD